MSKKYTKAVLQDLYDDQVATNEALEKRILDLEARLVRNSLSLIRSVSNTALSLMTETAKIIQDSSTLEKNSPYLKNVTEESWAAFSLLYAHYRKKGGMKHTRDLMSQEVLNYYSFQITEDLLALDDDIFLIARSDHFVLGWCHFFLKQEHQGSAEHGKLAE